MAALLWGVVRSIAVAAAAGPGAAAQPIAPLSPSRTLRFLAGTGGGERLSLAIAEGGRAVARSTTRAIGMASIQGLYGGGGLSRQLLTVSGALPRPLSSSAAFLGPCRFFFLPRAVTASCVVNSNHALQPKASDSHTVVDEQAGPSRSNGPHTREILMPNRIPKDQSSRSGHGRVVRNTGQRTGLDSPRNVGATSRNRNTLMENNLRDTEMYPGSLGVPFNLSRGLSSSAVLDRFDDNEGSDMDVETYKKIHEISTLGANVPDPAMTFASTGFTPILMKELANAGFSSPSAIQAMTWPIASKSRDVVAVAKTGSGKTLGYLIPAFLRVEKERAGSRRRSPLVLVLAPTRELANQIRDETWKFGRSSRISCTCICGGASKGPQLRDLERGVDVIIATPGRLNDLLEMNAVDLRRVSYLVLDEADRMLDMGFEPQIRSIVEQMPPQRQTLMYTATWPHEVRRIAKDLLNDPVQVNIGNSDQLSANKNITQRIEIISRYGKEKRLEEILTKAGRDSKVLIFCTTKRMCEELAMILRSKFGALALHGDKSQRERDYVMHQFKMGRTPILVATDVAARGLDIKDIRMVINYDFPTCIEDYVHRIGRTGRAGATGISHTFFGHEDAKHAVQLIKVLESTGQDVLPDLRQMAFRGDPRKGSSSRWGGRYSGNRGQYGNQRGGNDGWKWGQSDRSAGNKQTSNRFGGGSDRFSSANERFGSWNERFGSGGDRFGISGDRVARGDESAQNANRDTRMGNRIGSRTYARRDGPGSDKTNGGNLSAKWGLSLNSRVDGADSHSTRGKMDENDKRSLDKPGRRWGQSELSSLQDLDHTDRYGFDSSLLSEYGEPKVNRDGSVSLW